jgi:hypothetical protein
LPDFSAKKMLQLFDFDLLLARVMQPAQQALELDAKNRSCRFASRSQALGAALALRVEFLQPLGYFR